MPRDRASRSHGSGVFKVAVLGICLEPPSPIGPFMGVNVSIVRYHILGSSQLEGLSFVACPDRSGLKTSSVSLLTGVIEQNPGPSFMMRLA